MYNRTKNMEIKVGVFVFLILMVAALILVYIGVRKNLFTPRVSYYVISHTGQNVEQGMPVKLSGFKIGQVQEVSLEKDKDNRNVVKIELKILPKYREWFKSDIRMVLDQDGLFGSHYLNVVPGGEQNATMLSPGSGIELSKVGGIDEMIQEAEPVIEDLTQIVANIRDITDQYLDENGTVQATFNNLEVMTANLNSPEGLFYYLTRDPRPVQKIESILAHTDQSIVHINELIQTSTLRVEELEPLQQELVSLLKQSNQLLQEIRLMREKLDPALENFSDISEEVKKATEDLERLRAQTEQTLRLGSEMLDRLMETWPLRREEKPVPSQNHPMP